MRIYRSARNRGFIVLVLGLLVLGPLGVSAGETLDYSALEPVRFRLDRDLADMRRAVWVHSGSLAAGVVAPIFIWPIGTLIAADMAIEAGESYRRNVAGALGVSPLPSLKGARTWQTAGAVGYIVGTVSLGALATMALAQSGGGSDLDLPIAISAISMGSGYVLGITGTTVATWRARNTTVRFDRGLSAAR
ncbi:MAG: hypothetical protein EA403_13875 [Spirochaetaceae bacterium]|nr:MAG: hypothetical protein EA403_13875 [Spirochaetaceae bacterium]